MYISDQSVFHSLEACVIELKTTTSQTDVYTGLKKTARIEIKDLGVDYLESNVFVAYPKNAGSP